MGSRPKFPMPISERAKQFLPFAAVKGLNEALEKKEKTIQIKGEMTEESALELNEKFNRLQKGVVATIGYFCEDAFLSVTGRVTLIDNVYRMIEIDDACVKIDDILEIEIGSD